MILPSLSISKFSLPVPDKEYVIVCDSGSIELIEANAVPTAILSSKLSDFSVEERLGASSTSDISNVIRELLVSSPSLATKVIS